MGYDDPDYVTSNPNVQAGITFKSLAWAFTTGHAANWHPLTWISHLLDVQVFGLHPWGHHLTSDLVHAGNVILCFLVLHRLTRDRALAFFAALLFGIHPLRVESVAWISERKDVLATFFWFFSILAYTEYARGREPADRVRYYLSSLLLFGCGLLSKPMVVTLPFALMLLDYWPLQRVRKQAVVPILREKIPFFLLSCALAAVTIFVQGKGGAMQNPPPLLFRLENAVISYWRYLWKLFWPARLSPFYPSVAEWSRWLALIAAAGLAGVSIFALKVRKTRPWWVCGWFWYLGILVPVIGIVHAGDQAMADRYTYIPSLGILIILIAEFLHTTRPLWQKSPFVPAFSHAVAVSIPCLLCFATIRQVHRWRDTRTLFSYAAEVTRNNYAAHNNLGVVWDHANRSDLAAAEFREAIKERPGYAEGWKNLGNALTHMGEYRKADQALYEAIRLAPHYAQAYDSLGVSLTLQHKLEDAVRAFEFAIRSAPEDAQVRYDFGVTLMALGRNMEATAQFEAALARNPFLAEAHNNLGLLLIQQGRVQDGLRHYQEAIRLKPDYAKAYYNLGVALANHGAIDSAIAAFQEALRIQPDYPSARTNLTTLEAYKQNSRMERPK